MQTLLSTDPDTANGYYIDQRVKMVRVMIRLKVSIKILVKKSSRLKYGDIGMEWR